MQATRKDWLIGGLAMLGIAALLAPVAWWLIDGAMMSWDDDWRSGEGRRTSRDPSVRLAFWAVVLCLFNLVMMAGGAYSVLKATVFWGGEDDE